MILIIPTRKVNKPMRHNKIFGSVKRFFYLYQQFVDQRLLFVARKRVFQKRITGRLAHMDIIAQNSRSRLV